MRRPRVLRECRLGAVAGRVGCVASAAARPCAGESSCVGAWLRGRVVWALPVRRRAWRGCLCRTSGENLARRAGERFVWWGVVSHPAGRVVRSVGRRCRMPGVPSFERALRVRVRAEARASGLWACGSGGGSSRATWLILPVVICLSQRLSHACLSISDLYCETANGSLNQLWFI